jgi:diguanylate cyclase (GGDEF)-like protein
MITRFLRRYGLWPVIAAVTLISIGLSIAISAFVQVVVLGIGMPASAWLVTVGCPLLIAPVMSFHSFKLLLQLDRAHEDLRVVSITDHLTGVANRRHFMAQLLEAAERGLRDSTPFSVALVDIDNFKAINDQHGHLGGDEVLRQLARTCAAQVREGDTFARFGGEEFAVLLPHTGIEHAMHWLERLREHVAALRVELPTGSIGVTVSIGLAAPAPLAAHADGQINTALFLADQALYRAKREGKNRVALPMPAAA